MSPKTPPPTAGPALCVTSPPSYTYSPLPTEILTHHFHPRRTARSKPNHPPRPSTENRRARRCSHYNRRPPNPACRPHSHRPPSQPRALTPRPRHLHTRSRPLPPTPPHPHPHLPHPLRSRTPTPTPTLQTPRAPRAASSRASAPRRRARAPKRSCGAQTTSSACPPLRPRPPPQPLGPAWPPPRPREPAWA
ncbi:hypothetical protein DENSPDRAFT_425616 [Dentipellis sp. KUC8613]|nr:hypothetical protein DENSPDRAFT_425616 [Dentipellis sp. KUC8613]